MRVPAVHVAAVGDHAARHRPHLSPRAGEKRTGEEDQSLPERLEVALGGWKSKNLNSSPMLVMLFISLYGIIGTSVCLGGHVSILP